MSGCGSYNRFGRETDENGEDGQHLVKNEGEKYRQYQGAILAALAGTAAGTGDGWLLMSVLKHNESLLNNNKLKLFSYIMNLAALMGAIIAGYLVDKIGRKQTLILAGLMTLPTWILYMISHKILVSLSIGTALGGFASGIISVAVPLYIAEISETSVRGTLGCFFYLQFIAGELFTTLEGPDMNLNAVASNCIFVATVFLVTFIWMPESPFYLMLKGEENEAKMSIKFFRGSNYDIEEELENLKQAVSKRTSIKETFKVDNAVNALIISFLLMFISRLLAVDGFNYRLYKAWLHNNASVHIRLTTILLAIQIIGVGAAAFFIERLGRRLLLIISASLMALTVISCTLFDLFFAHDGKAVPFAFFTLYLASFSVGLGPVPWVLMNELIHHQHKALLSTFSAAVFWFMASTSSVRFKGILYLAGPYGILFSCLLLCIIVILLAVFTIPETKGKNVNMILVPNIKHFFLNFGNRVTNISVL